jgi:hypothetical protein
MALGLGTVERKGNRDPQKTRGNDKRTHEHVDCSNSDFWKEDGRRRFKPAERVVKGR